MTTFSKMQSALNELMPTIGEHGTEQQVQRAIKCHNLLRNDSFAKLNPDAVRDECNRVLADLGKIVESIESKSRSLDNEARYHASRGAALAATSMGSEAVAVDSPARHIRAIVMDLLVTMPDTEFWGRGVEYI